MSGAKEYLQVKFLKTLEPLGSLSVDKLEELANKSQVEELPPGRVVFRQGEKDARSTYLLSGQLELQVTGNPRVETVKAKTVEARYPVAQEWPRPSTCRTKTNAVLLHIDTDLLEILLSDDPSGCYEVTEIGVQEDPESDWMLRFLQSPAFLNLPTENIQKLLITLEEVPAKAGDAIIKQGDSDEYYYIVKQGKCSVSRRPAPSAEEVRLALLGPGDGFGEEALITQGKRNATITMKEDGVLMRLGKKDFHQLLVEPMLSFIDHNSMMDKVKAGASLIDVRTNKEFSENGLKGASNIPLSMLRVKAKDLNKTREHIVYCNDSHQSSAAAFLLGQQSLQVSVLEGGLANQNKPFSTASKAEAPPATTTTQPPVLTKPVEEAPAEDEYIEHRKKAEQQAKLANDAENARKSAIARTNNLKNEADQLRAQADRLANKTAMAEAERRKADEEINRVRQETLKQRDQILATAKQEVEKERQKAKQSEQEVSRIKREAEVARKRAEEELAKIRREAETVNEKQSKLDEEFRRAEHEKKQAERAAEVARIMAKQEAEQVKAEAEAIRLHAQQEAERIRQELEARKSQMAAEEAAKQRAALEEARSKSEDAMKEAARAAEEAKRQAALEAEAIRKQALKEAEELRNQLEKEKQRAAEIAARNKAEQLLRQQQLEDERNRALNEVRQQAALEAETIRKQAFEEAHSQIRLEAQRKAELEADAIRKQSEEFQRKALETARFEAEIAADAIRKEALAEAQRLRDEMAATRQLVENETRRAHQKIQEGNARRLVEEEAHARAAEEAARRAAEEAERRRRDQEAIVRQEAEAKARQRAEEARRLAEQEAALRKAEEAAEAKRQDARRKTEEERTIKAKKMAESIKHRMEESKQQKQQDEFVINTSSGPKLAKAKLHVVKDKTILEGEEDIFIFKAPSEQPPSKEEAQELIKQVEDQFREKSKKELPSFDIDYNDDQGEKKEPEVDTDSEFSDSVILELDNISANTKSPKREDDFAFELPKDISSIRPALTRKRPIIMLAASVVIMVTISVIAVTRPTYLDVNTVASWTEEEKVTPQRGLAAMRSKITNPANADLEDKVRNEAEKEYHQLLSSWRKQNNKAEPKSE